MFSYFKAPIFNLYPDANLSIREVYKKIIGVEYMSATDKLRLISGKREANSFKQKNFDFVTFSGIFKRRSIDGLLLHSNYICFDFDDVGDIDRVKSILIGDNQLHTSLLFSSPSGTGLKWIVRINTEDYSHSDWFNAISNYLNKTYGLKVDESGKDVSRACFLCYDNNAYIDPKELK